MITAEDYILYGFLAFIALLLVSIVVAMYRQSHDIGELRGQNEGIQRQLAELSGRIGELSGRIGELSGRMEGLSGRMDELTGRVDGLSERVGELSGRIGGLTGRMDGLTGRMDGLSRRMDGLTGRMERLEQIMASQGAELGEVKGILLALNRQMDLLMRHRHDGSAGQVILIPEEVAAA